MIINEKAISLNEESKQLSWNQFSKAFLDASPNGVAVTDCSFKTIISNKIAQEHLDIFTGTLIQTTMPELIEHSAAVLKDTIIMRDIQIIRHNKKFIARISPIIWKENTLGLFYIFQDVTMLEKVSRKMRSYQEMSIELDTIINSSHDGIWSCDGQGTIIKINPASEQLTGIKAENFIGKSVKELIDKKIIDRSVTLKVLKSHKKETIIQHTRHGKNLLITATPVFNKDGQLFRVVLNERDITEIEALKKEVEEKQALKTELEEDLLEMQLEALKSKKIIAKSHNFKTILEKAIKIARVNSSVLILGESGTGKGIIAETIHYHSNRLRIETRPADLKWRIKAYSFWMKLQNFPCLPR